MKELLKVVRVENDFIEFVNNGFQDYGVKILSIDGCICKFQVKGVNFSIQFYEKMIFPFGIYKDYRFNSPHEFLDKFALCILKEICIRYRQFVRQNSDLLEISKLIYF